MILIKDRHHIDFCLGLFLTLLGTMILIKDRHYESSLVVFVYSSSGNYDTYKGSTLSIYSEYSELSIGNYDTYKGSTHIFCNISYSFIIGNYDTYKGSTRSDE